MSVSAVARRLQAFPSHDASVHSAPAPATAPRRKLHIVLLDDEPSILKTWKAILEAHDFDATCCGRASDAIQAILRGCDCVVTDYHMPDMTGIEVILAAKPYTRAPFLVMTGNDSPQLRAAATAAGASCVLSKPAPIKSVLEIIDKLCGKDTH